MRSRAQQTAQGRSQGPRFGNHQHRPAQVTVSTQSSQRRHKLWQWPAHKRRAIEDQHRSLQTQSCGLGQRSYLIAAAATQRQQDGVRGD